MNEDLCRTSRTDTTRGVVAALFLAFTFGCGNPDRATPGDRGASLGTVSLELAGTVGDRESPDEGLTTVTSAAITDDGELVVFDMGGYQIKVFSRDGDLLRATGRRGEGPGEFMGQAAIRLFGDTVFVSGPAMPTWAMYTVDGEFLDAGRADPVPARDEVVRIYYSDGPRVPGARLVHVPHGPFRDGVISRPRYDFGGMIEASGGASDTRIEVARVMFPRGPGEDLDTVGSMEIDVGEPVPLRQVSAGVMTGHVPVPPFERERFDATREGRVVVGWYDTVTDTVSSLEVQWRDLDDTVVRWVQVPYEPRPWSSALLDRLATDPEPVMIGASLYHPNLGNPPRSTPEMREALARARRDAISFPEYQPPAHEVRVLGDGSVWILREMNEDSSEVWTVVHADGRILGNVEIPVGHRFLWGSPDEAVTVRIDDLGVPWVDRWALAAPEGGDGSG